MSKPQPVIVVGKADGVSFEEAFQNAMNQAPAGNLNRYKLIEFWVESGGVTGATTSFVRVEYSQG